MKRKVLFSKLVFLSFCLFAVGCGNGDHMPVEATDLKLSNVGSIGYKSVLPIFQNQCSACHNASSGPGQPNWMDYKTAFANKDAIYQQVVVTKAMPPSGNLSQSSRDLIGAWVKAGAPQEAVAAAAPAAGVRTNADNSGPSGDMSGNQDKDPDVGTKEKIGTDILSRGKYLVTASDCLACHTTKGSGSRVGAGGLEISLKFGSLFTPNITPDNETGIGRWTSDEFYRAVNQGIGKHGEYLYPAFPFTFYNLMSRSDVDAIYSYLMTLPPVRNKVEVNHLNWPYNIRDTLMGWRFLYFNPKEFVPDLRQSAEWNRGAFLVNGPGHCAACHTPRNFLGATKTGQFLNGAPVNGWYAPGLTEEAGNGVARWSVHDFMNFLGAGEVNNKERVLGPMTEVVEMSLSKLTQADLKAMSIYLKSLSGPSNYGKENAFENNDDVVPEQFHYENTKKIYIKHCSLCHGIEGKGVSGVYPPFQNNPLVNDLDAKNLINVILKGAPAFRSYKGMPAFSGVLSNLEIANVVNYLKLRWGSSPSLPNITASTVSDQRINLKSQ